jgi:hypothetical protein
MTGHRLVGRTRDTGQGWQVGVARTVDHPVEEVREPALAQLRQGKVDGPDPGVPAPGTGSRSSGRHRST